jgi:hypothetical protein
MTHHRTMRRRTPLTALILAPFVLWAVVWMWDRALLPLSVKMWRSEFAVRARLASGDAAARSKALGDAAAAREPDAEERARLLRQGLEDADPYVRNMAASWLGSPRTEVGEREALIARARQDPDAGVRRTAEAALEQWESRERSWPVEWWKLWRAGEYSKLGLMALTAVTIAAPVIIGLAFLIYFLARLLTYLYERRWRAVVVLPVMGVWAAASYGMFLLYFVAGHAGHLDGWKTFQLAGVLWLAIAFYAATGWGLHFAVRR